MGKIGMELLAPAGGMEQLRAAVAFGADAVYLAAERFGMRARAANFRMEEIPAAVAFAHDHGVKVHVTCNILMHPDDIDGLPAFFRALDAAGVDAFIIGDVGAFAVAGEVAPRVERHVSTQASVANATAARVWHSLGASRVVCAREMSLADIARLRKKTAFVFQNYNLVPVLNVYENIVLPIQLDGNAPDKAYVERIIETLGLEAKLQNLPNNLSGGQQQRVAIARALITKPAIILADEPTGNLDSHTSDRVIDLLKMTSAAFHQTIVMITHNPEIAAKADVQVRIEDGKIHR